MCIPLSEIKYGKKEKYISDINTYLINFYLQTYLLDLINQILLKHTWYNEFELKQNVLTVVAADSVPSYKV